MPVNWSDPEEVKRFRAYSIGKGRDPTKVDQFIQNRTGGLKTIQPGETLSGIAQQTGSTTEELARINKIVDPDIIKAGEQLSIPKAKEQPLPQTGQKLALSQRGPVSQRFGNKSSVEVFSGGINRGTDIAVGEGTKVALPPGNWQIIESFGGARRKGFVGNRDNRGYGNSIAARNVETGEIIRLSHLSKVGVRPGQTVKGGQVVALTGNTGNSTGAHLDIEYYDQGGRLRDILSSRYSKFYI